MVFGGSGKLYRLLVSSAGVFEKMDCVLNTIDFASEFEGACWVIIEEMRLKSQRRAIRLRCVSARRRGTDGSESSSRSSSMSSRRSSVRKVETGWWLFFDLSLRWGGGGSGGSGGSRLDDFGGLPKSRTGRKDVGSVSSMGSERTEGGASKNKV